MEDVLVMFGGEIKALGEGKVGGYLVRYSTPKDPDLEGDFFSKETDLGAADGGSLPVYYQHGMDGQLKSRRIGRGVVKYDDAGLWFEAQLELRDEYEQYIYELAQAGKLGWSSGAAGHLVSRESVGKSYHIMSWPIAEASLTPTPAEARNSAVSLKSLVNLDDAPEVSAEVAAVAEPEVVIEQAADELPEIKTIETGEKEMEEQEIKDLVSDAVKAAIADQTPVNAGGLKAAVVTKDPKHSASFGKALAAWAQGDNPAGFCKGVEMTMHPEGVKGAWEGGTDNEGGYAVPDDFYNSIVEQRDLSSWVRQAPVQRFVTNRDRILIPTESTAGTKLVVTDEEAGYDENEPVFGQAALTIFKFTKMIKMSEELMDGDAVGLQEYIASTIARAQAKAENYYCTVGTGSGMPQGLVYGSTSSSVMMATADTIVSTDITGALATLSAGYEEPGMMGLIMNPAVLWYIRGITGNPFQFAVTPQAAGDSILGIPVYKAPDADTYTVHSGKVITYANMGFYAFAERQGITVARNPYLYQANGIVGIFAKSRFGGVLTQAGAAVHMLGHND